MISKRERCARYVWAYVTRYPHVLAREIIGAQTDYSAVEVTRALDDLAAGGLIAKETAGGGVPRGYVALVPFVVQAPEWAAR